MTNEDIELRANRAMDLFRQGYNCSQSVFAACADLYGVEDQDLALKFSASFGGGIGRMRMVCGAASGMFMLAGLKTGCSNPGDQKGKMHNYAVTQQLANAFKAEHGSLICAELLGIAPRPEAPKPAERNDEYYKKRPCVEMVGEAVRIALRNLPA